MWRKFSTDYIYLKYYLWLIQTGTRTMDQGSRQHNSPKKWSDQEIIDMILAGGAQRERALIYLTHQCSPKLLSYARWKYWRLGQEKIDDAFSDALIDLIKVFERKQYNGQASICTFLNKIFHRRCIDSVRQKPTNQENVSMDDIGPLPSEENEDKTDSDDCLSLAMRNIPAKKRDLLADWSDGYSYEEMAARNQLTVNSVGPTLNLAKQQLEEAIRQLCQQKVGVCLGLCKKIT